MATRERLLAQRRALAVALRRFYAARGLDEKLGTAQKIVDRFLSGK